MITIDDLYEGHHAAPTRQSLERPIMTKGDLITYRGVAYVITSLRNGVHAVPARTVDEAGTSGRVHYLGSIEEVEAALAEQAERDTLLPVAADAAEAAGVRETP